MMNEPSGERIGELVRGLDPVPETPVEEIWAGIEAARRYRRPSPAWRRPALAWGLSLAASLAIGVAIGRLWTAPQAAGPREPATTVAVEGERAPSVMRVATVDHLARTEALLAAFTADARGERAQDVAAWATQLLLDTRLLLDSPASADPELAPLLDDLELVLAQIASLRGQTAQDDIQLIEDGIQQNRILARVRRAADAAGGINGDD